MNATDYLSYITNVIHTTIVATVGDDNLRPDRVSNLRWSLYLRLSPGLH